ncbi:MAG: elongation factor P, partial [Planctomycetota bacterium]
MTKIRATEIKKGMALILENELFIVVKRDHVTPGKGPAVNHIYLRNARTGAQKNLRLSSSDTVESAYLETKTCQYLYKDSSGYTFMDEATYDQFVLPAEVVGDLMPFIAENQPVNLTLHEGTAFNVD